MALVQAVRKGTGGGLAPWQVELALRLLLRDLCADFSVGDLAGPCGLSRSYFTKAFKVSLGLPPHRWLMRHRIQRAREMLERTNESISAIASSCGFADQSHLTRTFHATVGSSPAAWRREHRAGIAPCFRAGFEGRPH
jgi:AraC family transcriptional regulator